MKEPYLLNTANMSWRACVGVKQMRSNPMSGHSPFCSYVMYIVCNWIQHTEVTSYYSIVRHLAAISFVMKIEFTNVPHYNLDKHANDALMCGTTIPPIVIFFIIIVLNGASKIEITNRSAASLTSIYGLYILKILIHMWSLIVVNLLLFWNLC